MCCCAVVSDICCLKFLTICCCADIRGSANPSTARFVPVVCCGLSCVLSFLALFHNRFHCCSICVFIYHFNSVSLRTARVFLSHTHAHTHTHATQQKLQAELRAREAQALRLATNLVQFNEQVRKFVSKSSRRAVKASHYDTAQTIWSQGAFCHTYTHANTHARTHTCAHECKYTHTHTHTHTGISMFDEQISLHLPDSDELLRSVSEELQQLQTFVAAKVRFFVFPYWSVLLLLPVCCCFCFVGFVLLP